MNNTKTMKCAAHILLATLALAMADGTGTTLNYQGRIAVNGSDFNGNGFFKFRLLSENGEGTWANDGSGGTNEPVHCLTNNVSVGLFNVDLGDPYSGMAPLTATSFHHYELWLRTWFSTNSAGPFEQLVPDTRIHKPSFADIDTGNSVIVDSSGRGDFQDIQSAIDFIATNDFYWHTVLVWPGFYELSSPITLPTNRWLRIKGMGNTGDGASLWSTNGVAVRAGSGSLENLQLHGSPAIGDQEAPADYQLTVKHCALQAHNSSQPAVRQSKGHIELDQCSVAGSQEGGLGLDAGENANLNVTHCQMSSASNDPVVRLSGGTYAELESCHMFAGNTVRSALLLENASGSSDFRMCRFDGGISVSNSSASANFANCDVRRNVPGPDCVRIDNGSAQITLRGCTVDGNSNTAFHVRDAIGLMAIEDSRLNVSDRSAVRIGASPATPAGQTLSVHIRNSRISTSSQSGVTDQDAITLVNTCPAENNVGIKMQAEGTTVEGNIRDGISCTGPGCDVTISQCPEIGGYRNGISAPDGGEINVISSDVSCELGDGITISGGGMLWIRSSQISGGKDGAGRAIFASLNGVCMIGQSVIGSDMGPALEIEAGKCLCLNSFLFSATNTVALLKTTNVAAEFSNCRLYSIADLFGAGSTAPIITLQGTTGNTPIPRILSSVLEPARAAPHVIALAGGATTGLVTMAHCGMTTNLAPNIGTIPVVPMDASGNYRLPLGP